MEKMLWLQMASKRGIFTHVYNVVLEREKSNNKKKKKQRKNKQNKIADPSPKKIPNKERKPDQYPKMRKT